VYTRRQKTGRKSVIDIAIGRKYR